MALSRAWSIAASFALPSAAPSLRRPARCTPAASVASKCSGRPVSAWMRVGSPSPLSSIARRSSSSVLVSR
jgi:hypothetical protein